MKRNLILTSLLFLNTILLSQGSWLQKNSLPGNGRLASFAFSIGSNAYIGCGQTASSTYVSDFWEYNSEGIWTQKANFAGGIRYSPSAFTIDSIGYVCLGYTGQCKNDVWSYSPQTNTWTQKNNFPGTARYGAFSFSIGTKGYIGMGSIGGPPFLTDFWEYNSAFDNWIQKTSYNNNVGRIHGLGITLNNKGFAGLGSDDGNGHSVNDFYEYSPLSNTWTQKSNYPDARFGISYFAINECAYVGTGFNNNMNYNNSLWKYDPLTNIWTSIASVGSSGRSGGIGFAVGNNGFLGFGLTSSGSYLNDLWEYTPEASSIQKNTNREIANIRFDIANRNILLTINKLSQKASFKIYNISGQLISENKINGLTQLININYLKKGSYIYIININGKITSDKFIVH
ncbi:MAG: T9SS type A sorting domain-containing protein [Bacteroidales bacterium]